jgi:hypothetical protein
MTGEVYMLNLDRGTSISCWNSSEEIINEDEEVNSIVAVRHISWMGPQPPSSEGCLFIHLCKLVYYFWS